MRLVRSEMLEVLRRTTSSLRAGAGFPDRAVPSVTRHQEHAGAGDHHHRPATRRIHRVCHRDRNGFQWPAWVCCSSSRLQFADIPVMAAYLCLIALVFVDQLDRDLLVFRGRPAPGVDAPYWRIDFAGPIKNAYLGAALKSPVSFVHERYETFGPSGVICTPIPNLDTRSTARCLVANVASMGIEVHTGVGARPGGRHSRPPGCVGPLGRLRADMDACQCMRKNELRTAPLARADAMAAA